MGYYAYRKALAESFPGDESTYTYPDGSEFPPYIQPFSDLVTVLGSRDAATYYVELGVKASASLLWS